MLICFKNNYFTTEAGNQSDFKNTALIFCPSLPVGLCYPWISILLGDWTNPLGSAQLWNKIVASSLTILVGAAHPDFANPVFPSSLFCLWWTLSSVLQVSPSVPPIKIFTTYSPFCLWLISLSLGFHQSISMSPTSLFAHSLFLPTPFTLFHLVPCIIPFFRTHLLTSADCSRYGYSAWLRKFQWVPMAWYMKSLAWQKDIFLSSNSVSAVEGT